MLRVSRVATVATLFASTSIAAALGCTGPGSLQPAGGGGQSMSSTASATGSGGATDPVTLGRALSKSSGCNGCHDGSAGEMAGGDAAVPGTGAWAPNLTPDMDTGIGSWSADLIVRAMRQGVDDDTEELCPTMPRFPAMSDADANAIVAYLHSLAAISNQVPDSICPPLKTGEGGGGMGGSSSSSSSSTSSSSSSTTSSSSSSTTSSSSSSTSSSSSSTSSSSSSTSSSSSSTSSSSGGAACSLDHLVISEIRSRGAGGASDEFIELYNPTSADVTLDATWTLQSRSVTSATYSTRWKGAGVVIPAHGHFLIVGLSYTQSPAKDAQLSSGITDAASITLRQGTTVVDAVCYGYDAASLAAFDATFVCEGAPVSNAPHANSATTAADVDVSIERKPGGAAGNCTDSGDNASDFASTTPATPMSSQSPPTP